LGVLGLVVGLLAGFAGGALWGAFAGWLKAKRGVNEVITTLLLNYVAIQLVLWAVSGPMKATGATFPRSQDLPDSVLLPPLIPGTQAHIGVVFGVVATLVFAWVLRNSVFGYRMRALQGGTGTPLYAGFPVDRLTIAVLAISGGAAGLAGAVEILGVQHHLVDGFSPGYGFDALAVALLSRGNPIAVMPTALFFGILRSGANAMQRATGVPSSIVFVIQGIAVLFVISGYALEAIARKRRSARAALHRSAAPAAAQRG
jgi:simple sugar transport system permease protein